MVSKCKNFLIDSPRKLIFFAGKPRNIANKERTQSKGNK
jgi:hypothetical protein